MTRLADRADRVVAWTLYGDWTSRLRLPPVRAALLAVAVLAAALLGYKAVSNQLSETRLLHENRVSLVRYFDGTVPKPFAYRVLDPIYVRAVRDAGVPAMLRALPGVGAAERGWCAHASSDPLPSCDDVAAYVVVAWAECTLFLLLIYALGLAMADRPVAALALLGGSFLAINGVFELGFAHLYDFDTLAMAALLLLCIMRGGWRAFTAALLVASLAKETLALYALAFLLANLRRQANGRSLVLFGLQVVLVGGMHLLLMRLFADNGGVDHEPHLAEQLRFFTERIDLPLLVQLAVALAIVCYRFTDKPLWLRRSSIVVLPWFVLFLLGAKDGELRNIMEVLPLLLLLAFDSALRWTAPALAPTRSPRTA